MDFLSSLSKWFNEKTGSPLYFTYAGFFVAWNWKFFQVVFLESPQLFTGPRVGYVEQHIFFSTEVIFSQKFPGWAETVLDWALNFSWHVVPPALLTMVTILFFPRIHKWALDKYLDSYFERREMFESKRKNHEERLLEQTKKRSKTLENIVLEKEKQILTEKKIEKSLSDEERWEIEHDEFSKNFNYFKFRQILEVIYKFGGWIQRGKTDIGALAMADTMELISRNAINGDQISLSQKGKFFAKKYLEKNPL